MADRENFSIGELTLGGALIEATAAELNKLDGATLTTDELNTLAGITATVSELNKLAGATLSTSEMNTLTGITAATAELNLLDASVVTEPADGLWASLLRIAKAEWDFAVDGGTQGAIGLGVTIPDNAIIVGGFVEVITTLADGSSDLAKGALSILAANDLVTSTTIADGADLWDAGIQSIVPAGTGATAIKLTSAKEITFTIADVDITAGKFNVWLRYVMGE